MPVVVAEVVVARDRGELDAGAYEEVDERGLHLGLAGLEVVAADVGGVFGGQVDNAGDEGVLRGSVDERAVLEDGGDGEDGGGGDFCVRGLNGMEEVGGRVVDARLDGGKTLGVGGPLNDNLV